MLTARNRIRSGSTDEPSFSVSFPLYCAEYNQGCDGGYGFLQTKWSEDVGLVPEKCNPFNQGGGSCSATKNCDLGAKRYRATNHHYVGGFYGGSDADAIRQELLRGPLVMSFEPQEDFMYYKSGVYRSGPHKIHQEWEQVDHAVLLIGFGAEKDQAYWTCQNSWGTDWGEDGFFRMARGIDESGCESIVVSADVVEEDENPVLADFLQSL
jgi:cathepsin C